MHRFTGIIFPLVLSVYWDRNYDVPAYILPYDVSGNIVNYEYNANVKSITQAVWEKAFNTVANCNLLIQNAEQREANFFDEGRK